MNTDVFTIYDKVACEAGPLFQAKNIHVAMRYVNEMIKDNKINLHEYDLVRLGSFDSESMSLAAFPKADAIELTNCVTFTEDSKEFMENYASPDDVKQFKEKYLSEEDN